MTLTGLRSMTFSKHLPKTILLSLPFPKTSCRGSPPGSEHHTRNLDLTKDRDLYRAAWIERTGTFAGSLVSRPVRKSTANFRALATMLQNFFERPLGLSRSLR